MKKSGIKFKNVSFRYAEDEPWALKDVSFSIYPGEWVAVIGHNGSGKSTIAKLMNGLLFPEQGEVHIGEVPMQEDNIWEIRSKIGMVFQNPDNQFVGTTVKDDVAFGMENRGMPREEMLVRLKTSLQAVRMEGYELHEPHRLSGGQKQRVAIAGVLAISPDVIILDEATAMLDPQGRKDILKTMKEIKEKDDLSLITITHDLNEVTLAERVIVLNQGEIWNQGSPREIFSHKQALQEIGLDTPFVARLADEFIKLNVPVGREPLNHEELLEELWTYHLNK